MSQAEMREFGYGDPLAEVGTEGWAKRTRIVLLSKVDGTKFTVHDLKCYLEPFVLNHGWRLLDRQDGRRFLHFRDFVSDPKPWGLGTDYTRFRGLVASEIGEREFDRLTASESAQGARADLTSGHDVTKSDGDSKRAKRLRAINRAPAFIQQLYDRDLMGVDVATKFGPKCVEAEEDCKSDMQRRADVLQGRVETLQLFQPQLAGAKLKRQVNVEAREVLDLKPETRLEQIKRLWHKLAQADRTEFTNWQYTPEANPQ